MFPLLFEGAKYEAGRLVRGLLEEMDAIWLFLEE